MLDLERLWNCPLCSAKHKKAVICCKRCGCQLLMLNKIKLQGWYLAHQGKTTQSAALFPPRLLQEIVCSLPKSWNYGPGFITYS